MLLKQLTNELIEKLIVEIKKKENMDRVQQHFIDPIITYTFHRLYPYIIVSSGIFILTFLLALCIFLLVIRDYMSYSSPKC